MVRLAAFLMGTALAIWLGVLAAEDLSAWASTRTTVIPGEVSYIEAGLANWILENNTGVVVIVAVMAIVIVGAIVRRMSR